MESNDTESIRLTVPATSAAVRIARAGAAALATRAGFSYREVEQLRLAVGEAAALLAPDAEGDGRLELVYDLGAGGLLVDLHLAAPGGPEGLARVPVVAAAVLDNSVDEWRLGDGGRRLVLVKRRSGEDDDADDV